MRLLGVLLGLAFGVALVAAAFLALVVWWIADGYRAERMRVRYGDYSPARR